MICISIAQESRRLALADMLNAAQMGADLLEVRLDCFENAPDPKELLAARRKPVIFSCRRTADGGNWKGTEDERVMLLKTAIVSQADYCELEMDVAHQVRRFGACQRVISYTNLKETPSDIAEIYEEMRQKDPDIIKLTCKARTPEEAWPLVQILAKPPVPTVVVGLGRPGLMLAVLGRKMGAPFTAAALEKGMEAYPGQPTVSDLEKVYHYRDIDRQTKLVGVTGTGEREFITTALLNTAFAKLSLPIRCLPLQVGNVKLFRKVIEAVRLLGVVVEEEQQDALREVAGQLDEDARGAMLNQGALPVEHAVDLLVQPESKTWHGAHTFGRAAVAALEDSLRSRERNLDGTIVMVAGLNSTARSIARAVKERGGKLIFGSHNRDEATKYSRLFGGRHVMFEGIYTTLHDVLVVCRDAGETDDEKSVLHPGFLKAGMTVMDLTQIPRRSPLLQEASLRGCAVFEPTDVLVRQVVAQVQRLTGQEAPRQPLDDLLADLIDEE